MHKTQKVASDFLVRMESEQLTLPEGFMVIALMLRCVGLQLKWGPKKTINYLVSVMIRLAEVSKKRERTDLLWVPKGIGLE